MRMYGRRRLSLGPKHSLHSLRDLIKMQASIRDAAKYENTKTISDGDSVRLEVAISCF